MNVIDRDTARAIPPALDEAQHAVVPPAERQQSRRLKPLLSLLPYVARYRWQAIAALMALVIAAVTTLLVPIAVRRMIDFGFSRESANLIDSYFAVMIVIVAVLALASASRFYLVTTLGERIVADLREGVFGHLVSLSLAYFDEAKTGELVSRLTADTTQIKAAVGASVSIALRNSVLFIGAATMMVVTSPRLSAFVLAAIPVIVLPLYGFGRAVRRRSRWAQDTLADATAYASEMIGAVRVLQAFTNEAVAKNRFGAAVERAFRAAQDSIKARAILTAIAIFLVFASVVVVLWVGAQDVLTGRMSAGRLSQFVLYAVFAAAGLGQLSEVWGELSQASGAAERLFEILNLRPAIVPPLRPIALPEPPRGEVAFVDVRFSYPARSASSALGGVSFVVRQGERVAIVGPSGAGKSTIFHLILRYYDPSSGVAKFDGVPLVDVDPLALRRRIALVPQEAIVFAASIRDNIRFGRPEASDPEVERAAELAHALEFISLLPEKFDTTVGERGVTLSGGERQRIAIARAILRGAPLLLLDEATSALDAESETLVRDALGRLMQGRTTLVIAHRLATVLSCDRILVMEAGRIVEEGSHQTLVAAGGLYARLARLQFQP
ncbi:MAG: ATP-binding cassette domain-containing protein [Alphaproteobacteria bacterium]|nr:MAG: ATP-binding cassette domain-containing protein [Alphaproteobacteria bacterium]TMJ90478.1 MAG: ATP-binding cassette domain-containing protein [Alphaproteobacteria bacterium]